jgi:hypothetical protein
MPDNLSARPLAADNIATDYVDGAHHVRVKVQHGADNSATDVSAASPLPVGIVGGISPATIPAAVVMQNAATGIGNGTTLPVTGYAVALLSVTASVAMSGGTAITFEASTDDTTWVSIAAHSIGINGALTPTTTTVGDYRIAVDGYKSLRARISTYSAGTITVRGYVSPTAGRPTCVSPAVPAGTLRSVALTGANQIISATPRDMRGIFIRETGGTANALVQVYDNASAASGTVYPYALGPNESTRETHPEGGVPMTNGIYVKVTGAVEGTIVLGP